TFYAIIIKIGQKQNVSYYNYIVFFLYLYFLGLSLRNTSSKTLDIIKDKKKRISMFLYYGIGYKGLVHLSYLQQKEENYCIFIIGETII
ncbi:MAG TPA: hypothetical protein VFP49_00620, partial [Nitrososphaeraceae archaeon]|nr:hypothetical protein [Nitrososphaeraceae archaeon]